MDDYDHLDDQSIIDMVFSTNTSALERELASRLERALEVVHDLETNHTEQGPA